MREQHGLTTSLIPWIGTAVLFLMLASGCQNSPSPRTVASAEPSLSPAPEGGAAVVATPTPRNLTFVDRHPLLYKPREYYETSGDNKLVKTAAATVIGIPAGIFGELRQIVVGAPTEPRY